MKVKSTVVAASADLAAVIVFVAIGRRNHAEGVTLDGVAMTAAPFVMAGALGWLLLRAWRHPTSVRTGIGVWAITMAAGMLLRRMLFGDGTAMTFIIVAALFTAATIIGWRVVASALAQRRVE